MHHEQRQHHDGGPADESPETAAAAAGWDPHEQVGDIYALQLEPGQPPDIEKVQLDHPSIWVGSWLDYNNGVLHGQWIDAAREATDVWSDIEAMLAASPTARSQPGEIAEDWGIFDYDNFGPLQIGEQESVNYVTTVARGIAEHGPAFAAWADVMQGDEELDQGAFEDNYLGEYESPQAYAEHLIEDAGYDQLLDEHLPEGIRRYVHIDIAGLAQDMWMSGDFHQYPKDGGGVYIFRGQ